MKFLLVSPKNRPTYNFRGDLIKEIISRGYEVHVTGPDQINLDKILELGANFHEVPLNKDGTNIISDFKYFLGLYKVIKEIKPDVVLSYTVKPNIFGSIAAKLASVKRINSMITGGGYILTSKTFKAKVLGLIVKTLYKIAFICSDNVIFQNNDDLNEFCDLKLVNRKKCRLVSGSGVNLEKFTPQPFPEDLSFFMLSRLLKCKGVCEYLKAAEIIKKDFPNVKFYLLGKIETEMLDAVPENIILDYINRGVVELFPEAHDVRPYFAMSSVYVLPSYREGVPRTVLEAMASSRPIITTDTNGCRDTVKDSINGFLVPVADVNSLVDAMKKFIFNPDLILEMGKESLKYCQERFDVNIVNDNLCDYMKISKLEV